MFTATSSIVRPLGDKYMRRCTLIATLGSSISGNLTGASYSNSYVVNSNEWANLSANFLRYRVHAVSVQLTPYGNVQAGAATTQASSTPVAMCVWACQGSYIPATFTQVASSSGGRVFMSYQKQKLRATWDLNPDAKLFTTIGTSIEPENTYGIAIEAFATGFLPASAFIYTAVIEWIVEFSGITYT